MSNTTWFDDRTWSVSGNKEELLRISKESITSKQYHHQHQLYIQSLLMRYQIY